MSNTKSVCKYLDAGAKSSAVVLDPNLSTGNEQTIYLYHQQRDRIIEYRRDIVEAKLRELSDDEAKGSAALLQAYQQARADFLPRGETEATPVKAPPPKAMLVDSGDTDDDMPYEDVAVGEE